MSKPIKELIMENIATTVASVTVAAGYNQTLTALRPSRRDMEAAAIANRTVVIRQAGMERSAQQANGTEAWTLTVELRAYIVASDSSSAAVETATNYVEADLHKALAVDRTRGGKAHWTELMPPRPWLINDEEVGVIVPIEIAYRTDEDNPYTQM